ncbi:MAG: hypothetical protein U5K72_11635 [Balneolaceae bacterium]|nr:hypothetical protein [Balneolaceae bacterium]
MKNQKLLFLLILLSLGIASICSAQETDRNIMLEAGIGYGSQIETLGFKGGAVYQINDQIRGTVDGIYYLSGEDSNGLEFNWLEFNVNGHYLFVKQQNSKFYLLSGLNFATLFSDHSNIRLPGGDATDTVYVGLNIGTGAEFSLGSVNAFLEGKYALSSAHQLVLTTGLRIPL